MELEFDHAVVVVRDLGEATDSFREAGFVVTPGGRHDALPTENALVAFADGGYLELLAVRDDDARDSLRALRASPRWEAHVRGASAIARRFLPRLAGPPGVGDFVLRGRRLARFAAESRRRGFAMTGPVPMSRARADGETLAWDLLLPADDHLPFFIEDRTPIERRIPRGDAARHPNGAAGVRELVVRAPAVAAAALAWADLLDVAPHVDAAGGTVLALGALRVALADGAPAGACAVTIAGCGPLPPALESLGLRGA